ncbi:deoxynucleoside kinase [archaeon]|jgi:deoxyadenosine/deoxycytidine kinase|nr:deoxynucleoside kinase [archaeon]MBT3731418.1 deoxynucleoside kinase [archaeon]MBT4670279.1 deoxynucleoside kinase [archaeon]MBT5029703.1 deoxynucleoside kinase [archaeon]MBT5287548.1 deoxynucleoside kinase [archaeon]
MKEKGDNIYVVFSGHMCTGKDTIIEILEKRGNLPKIAGPNAKVHILSEAVNHDQDVLASFYKNMEDTTEFFELGTLCFRSVLSSIISKVRGIVVGNRHVIEARQTFVEHSRSLKNEDKRFFDETATGVYDMLLRRAIEKGIIPIPEIVFFLFVDDDNILIERNKKRNDPGEKSIDPEYIKNLSVYFENYRKNFADIYNFFGVPVPKLVEINTSVDLFQDEQALQQIAERCEDEIRKAYAKKRRSLFDFDEQKLI